MACLFVKACLFVSLIGMARFSDKYRLFVCFMGTVCLSDRYGLFVG